jgi:hypothetical protein
MRLQDLIDHVGEPMFEEARRWAWQTAAGTGIGVSPWPNKVNDVPHELEDLIWLRGDGTWLERVALAFELYRTMPCYANLMYIQHHHNDWNDDARRLFWNEYRSLVGDPDDRLADPVAYSLWCDYFEDPEIVEEAWQEIARRAELSERGLQRVLDARALSRSPSRSRSTTSSPPTEAGTYRSSGASSTVASTTTATSKPTGPATCSRDSTFRQTHQGWTTSSVASS